MERYIISIGTVTYALKGRDLLRKLGFKAYVERNSRDIGKYGCGYSIVVSGDIDKIADSLTENGIRIMNIEKNAAR